MGDAVMKPRSNTMPTTASSASSSLSIKSTKVLVYDMAENTTKKMSRHKFDSIYNDTPLDCISVIPLPKGVSDFAISPDDLRSHSLEDTSYITSEQDRSQSPEPMDGSDYIQRQRPFSVSYTASVHIPTSVFYARMFSPSWYSDLVVVSRPSSLHASEKSTRSNTADSHPETD